jgi:tRNA dimethylallyltransferase
METLPDGAGNEFRAPEQSELWFAETTGSGVAGLPPTRQGKLEAGSLGLTVDSKVLTTLYSFKMGKIPTGLPAAESFAPAVQSSPHSPTPPHIVATELASLSPSTAQLAGAGEIPVLCIVGPTGSGKSGLALQLAKELNGEIVNCDSLQVFRGFDIGTAKPSPAERAAIPHHLIDIAAPGDEFTAGEFARRAREVIPTITDREKLPLVAGGTGFYLKALVDGLVEGPRRDEKLRARLSHLEAKKPGRLHALLARWDPPSAARIHVTDIQKLVRALEVILLERQPLSTVYQRPRDAAVSFRVFQVGLNPPRAELYRRLDARAEAMWQGGLLEEVEALLRNGLAPNAKPFGAIGYKQALAVLQGRLSPATALEEMKRDTRRYAKRQLTWFRRDMRIHWIPDFGDSPYTHRKVVYLLYHRFFWY